MEFLLNIVKEQGIVDIISDYVDNYLLARDSKALRNHIRQTQPDVDLTFFPSNRESGVNIPIGVSFFWPDA